MALHLCRETFTGELAPGLAKTFHAGVDLLDDSEKDEAALLKKFGVYFSEAVSTHLTPPPTEAEVAATKKAAKSRRAQNVKAKVEAEKYSPPTFSAPTTSTPTPITTNTSSTTPKTEHS